MSELRVNTITDEDGTGSPAFPNGVKDASQLFTTTIGGSDGTSDWTQATGSDPWIATKAVSGILSTDKPFVDINLSSVALADVADTQSDWSLVYRVNASADDEIKFYATNEPTKDLMVQIQVVR